MKSTVVIGSLITISLILNFVSVFRLSSDYKKGYQDSSTKMGDSVVDFAKSCKGEEMAIFWGSSDEKVNLSCEDLKNSYVTEKIQWKIQ